MNQATRVFIISLDGATFDVIRPLARQGYMPNLKRMLREGLSAELESIIPPVTAPAWTSFMTGKQPSKQPRHRHNRRTLALTTAESKDMLTLCAAPLSWDVAP